MALISGKVNNSTARAVWGKRLARMWIALFVFFDLVKLLNVSLYNGFVSITVLLVALFLPFVAYVSIRNEINPFKNSFIVAVGAFVLWYAFSLLWSVDKGLGFRYVMSVVRPYMLMVVIYILVVYDPLSSVVAIATAIAIVSFETVLGLYFMFFAPMAGYDCCYRHFYVPTSRLHALGNMVIGRLYGFEGDPNGYGLTAAIAFFFAVYFFLWALENKKCIWIVSLLFGVLLSLLSVVAAMSRSVWMASVPGAIIIMKDLGKKSKYIMAFLVLVTFIGALFIFPSIIARFNITYDVQAGRLPELHTALRYWRDSPIVGIGPGSYFRRIEMDREIMGGRIAPRLVHNSYLRVMVESGIIGFALFLLAGLLFLWSYRVTMKTNDHQFWGIWKAFIPVGFLLMGWSLFQGILSFNLVFLIGGIYAAFTDKQWAAESHEEIE